MNGSACAYGGKAYNWTSHMWDTYLVSSFKAKDVVYWEGNEFSHNDGDWWDGSNSGNQGMTSRHTGRGTLSCFDGHVELMATNDYWNIVKTNGYNRFNNVPH
jgi:prepilin-type processing-associated H-X9-DG protein